MHCKGQSPDFGGKKAIPTSLNITKLCLQKWVFPPSYNWGCPCLAAEAWIFDQYPKHRQEGQKFPKCCVANNASRKKWLDWFFLLSDRGTPQPFSNTQCTCTIWVTQLFKPHLLHSYPCHPGERSSIRLKWHTLKYSRRDHPQYAPKVHLSNSLNLGDIDSLHHAWYPFKDYFNYSRGKIILLYTSYIQWLKKTITPSTKSVIKIKAL